MIEILILSLIQGVAEFIPVSSSSHLIVVSKYLNFNEQSLSIDVSLHMGSFLAVVVYFYKDLLSFFKNRFLFLKIFISSVPVMIVGFFLVKFGLVDKIRNLETIAWMTIIFGVLLYISDRFNLNKSLEKDFTYKSAIIIGLFQILSLIPGVSRSGIAITAARLLNFERVDSAKISFFLSIPVLGAVSFFGLKNLIVEDNFFLMKLNLLSTIFSFIFSLITIKYFLKYIKNFNLNLFVYYRILLGLVLLYLTL